MELVESRAEQNSNIHVQILQVSLCVCVCVCVYFHTWLIFVLVADYENQTYGIFTIYAKKIRASIVRKFDGTKIEPTKIFAMKISRFTACVCS